MLVKYGVYLKGGIVVFLFALFVNLFTCSADGSESKELAELMKRIDTKYKAAEAISGYYEFSDENWDTFFDSGKVVAEITEKVQEKYGRPGNAKYQRLMEEMRDSAQKMADVVKNNKGAEGSLEEVQWQVRRMRNSCAHCHRLLNIHLYPNLYHIKKQGRIGGIHEEWGEPEK